MRLDDDRRGAGGAPPASPGEAAFALHVRAHGLRGVVAQHAFAAHLGRKFCFDFALPEHMLAVEVDGQVHRIKARFRADQERHNLAQVLGWRVLRFSTADVLSGKAIDSILALITGNQETALAVLQRPDALKKETAPWQVKASSTSRSRSSKLFTEGPRTPPPSRPT